MSEFPQLTRGQKIGLVVAAIALMVLIILTIAFLLNNPPVALAVRNLLIIVVAVQILILDIITIVLLLQVVKLLRYLIEELVPVVNSLQETVGTVRGTTTFMSDTIVNPAIEAASKVAGIRGSLNAVFGGNGSRSRTTPKAPPAPGASSSGRPTAQE